MDEEALQLFFAGKSNATERLVADDELLSFVPTKELYGTIQAGCNFHHVWGEGSLANLQREMCAQGKDFPDIVNALGRKTSKLQARYVGQVLYKRAQKLFEAGRGAKRAGGGELDMPPKRSCSAPTALRNTTNTQHATPASDMKFQPFEGGLQLFVPSEVVLNAGPDASVAVRTAPAVDAEQIHGVKAGMAVAAIAHCKNWLQISTDDSAMACSVATGYVQRALPGAGGLVLLEPKPSTLVSDKPVAVRAELEGGSMEERSACWARIFGH